MYILQTQLDYDSIRYALGLEKDQGRLLTDDVINGLSHLPMAELEVMRRYQPPYQMTDVFTTVMERQPLDPSKNALKAGACLLTCAFLCPRLEITIPIEVDLDSVGSAKRKDIDWIQKKQQFIDQANWFLSLVDQVLAPNRFPGALYIAPGKIFPNDPIWYQKVTGFSGMNLAGYTYPATGGGWLYGYSWSPF